MHCSAACTWAAPSLPQASALRSTRSPNWRPTYWYPDTAPAGEHNTPSPPRYPTAGSKAAAAPATSSPLPYLPGGRTWPVPDMARSAIVEYIAWYKGTLLHSTLGYRSPPNSNKETRSRSSLTESSALSVKAEQPQDATAEVPDSGRTGPCCGMCRLRDRNLEIRPGIGHDERRITRIEGLHGQIGKDERDIVTVRLDGRFVERKAEFIRPPLGVGGVQHQLHPGVQRLPLHTPHIAVQIPALLVVASRSSSDRFQTSGERADVTVARTQCLKR